MVCDLVVVLGCRLYAGEIRAIQPQRRSVSRSANTFRLRPLMMSISWPRHKAMLRVAKTAEPVGLARKNAVSSTPPAAG